jgi:hypothetical protein
VTDPAAFAQPASQRRLQNQREASGAAALATVTAQGIM